MDAHVPSALAVPQVPVGVVGEPLRRSANYHPTVWGDRFLAHASDSLEIEELETTTKIQQLKKEVRGLITNHKPLSEIQMLTLIDDIQRLGVSYHFEDEIDGALERIYHTSFQDDPRADPNLHAVSLRFRLLRQHGYNVSCDVFKSFMNEGSVLKESQAKNVQALLSFYEATQFQIRGEDSLADGHAFIVPRLEHLIPHLSPQTAAQVRHALKRPIHKGLQRLEARYYIDVYESRQDHKSHHKPLLMFAKLDFNLVQKVHQHELTFITRWWKELNFAQKLPFARDRIVECYFWASAVFFRPEQAFARNTFTKVIKITSIMDDIYDVHGTPEELELLTNAIERWDIDDAGKLPEYLKIFYKTLLDIYDEIEEQMAMKETSYMFPYAREAMVPGWPREDRDHPMFKIFPMKAQSKAYMEEARWFKVNKLPKMEEYMRVALVSSAYSLLAITAMLGMGSIATKSTFEWMSKTPKILKASTIICRLMDDMVSHEFERKRGHVASAVECYMYEYSVSKEAAFEEFHKQVIDAWTDINQECMRPYNIPKPILMIVVNLARVIDFIYKDEDGYTHSAIVLKNAITSLFVDSVPI